VVNVDGDIALARPTAWVLKFLPAALKNGEARMMCRAAGAQGCWLAGQPALADWAKLCRASGAGLPWADAAVDEEDTMT
jgi:hypothetical protein